MSNYRITLLIFTSYLGIRLDILNFLAIYVDKQYNKALNLNTIT